LKRYIDPLQRFNASTLQRFNASTLQRFTTGTASHVFSHPGKFHSFGNPPALARLATTRQRANNFGCAMPKMNPTEAQEPAAEAFQVIALARSHFGSHL